jgi:hypothetical protein
MCTDVKYRFTNCGDPGDKWVEPCSYARDKASRLCSEFELRLKREVKREQCCSIECCKEILANMQHELDNTKDWKIGLIFYTAAGVLRFNTPWDLKSFMRQMHQDCQFDEYGKAV